MSTPSLFTIPLSLQGALITTVFVLSGCSAAGETTPKGGSPTSVGGGNVTAQVTGVVNSTEIGGSGLSILSAHQGSTPVNGANVFSTTASTHATQMLFLLEKNGNLRALVPSVPDSGTLSVDATSTAAGLLFLSPGIITTNPTETRLRIAELEGLTSFAALVEFLRSNLPTRSLTTLASELSLPGLIAACINEWIGNHPPPQPDPSAMTLGVLSGQPGSTTAVQQSAQVAGVRLVLPQLQPNMLAVPVTLENHGWRLVQMYKVQRNQLDQMIGVPTLVSSAPLNGETPFNLGSLFTRSFGQPSSQTDVLDFSSNAHKIQYWIMGAGMGAGAQWPDELRYSGLVNDALDISLLSRTVWDYAVVPLVCVLTGLLPNEVATPTDGLSVLFSGSPTGIDVLNTPGATFLEATEAFMNVVTSMLSVAGKTLPLPAISAVLSAANLVTGPSSYALAANWYLATPHVSMIEVTRAGVQFSSPTYTAAPTAASIFISVNRVGDISRTDTVTYATNDGSAKAEQDYKATAGTLTFNPNETSKGFTVPLLSNPARQRDTAVNLKLSLPGASTSLGSPATAVLRIAGAALPPGGGGLSAGNAVVTVDMYPSFPAAINTIGASIPTTLLMNGASTVTRNTTVPPNVTLQFDGAGQLSVDSGVTVTIDGPLTAPARQIFSGTGVVLFGPTYKADIYPQWWGAVFDSITDDSAAWQAAINAASAGSRVVITGISAIGSAGVLIDKKTDFTLDGEGHGGIKVKGAAVRRISAMGTTVIAVTGVANTKIHGLTIDGNNTASNLIGMFQGTGSEISDNWTTSGGQLAAITVVGGSHNRILRNVVRSTIGSARGYWIGNSNTVELETDVLVSNNQAYNIPASCYAVHTLRGRWEYNLCDTTIGVGSGFAISSAPAPLNSTSSTVLYGNTARRTAWHGFQSDANTINGVSSSPVDITLEANISEENGHSGFYIVNATRWTLIRNVARYNPRQIIIEKSANITLRDNVGF